MKPIIPIYPPEFLKEPEIVEATRGLPSPVSIEHSLTGCERCGRSGWIGPRQRAMAEAGGGEVVCGYCIKKDPMLQNPAEMTVYSLNPDIDQAPRRIQ